MSPAAILALCVVGWSGVVAVVALAPLAVWWLAWGRGR